MKNAKKFMSLAMVLLMVLSLAPTAVYAENTGNLLTNGGFEAAVEVEHQAPGWDYESGLTKNYVSVAGENAFIVKKGDEGAHVHSGNNALKLVNGGTAGRWISQEVKGLTPGKAYRASVWVYVDGELDKGVSLRVSDTKKTGESETLGGSNGATRKSRMLSTTDGVWKNLDCAFVPAVKEDYDATFVYISLEFGKGTALVEDEVVNVYVDDMVFEEISTINGSFEDTEHTVSGDTASTVWAKGWSTTGAGSTREATIGVHAFIAASAGQNNTNALCLTTTEEEPRQLHAYIPVTGLNPGSAYKMRCYIKTSLTGSLTKPSLNVIKCSGLYNNLHLSWGSPSVTNGYKNATATTEWKELSFVFTAEDTYAFIGLGATPVKNECIYFDDVTIEETNIKFTAADGTVLGETLSAAGSVNAKATVVGAEGDTARMLVGVYEMENDVPYLVQVYVSETTTLTSTKWADITSDPISLSAGQYAKALLLDGTAGLQPLTEAKILTVSAS